MHSQLYMQAMHTSASALPSSSPLPTVASDIMLDICDAGTDSRGDGGEEIFESDEFLVAQLWKDMEEILGHEDEPAQFCIDWPRPEPVSTPCVNTAAALKRQELRSERPIKPLPARARKCLSIHTPASAPSMAAHVLSPIRLIYSTPVHVTAAVKFAATFDPAKPTLVPLPLPVELVHPPSPIKLTSVSTSAPAKPTTDALQPIPNLSHRLFSTLFPPSGRYAARFHLKASTATSISHAIPSTDLGEILPKSTARLTSDGRARAGQPRPHQGKLGKGMWKELWRDLFRDDKGTRRARRTLMSGTRS